MKEALWCIVAVLMCGSSVFGEEYGYFSRRTTSDDFSKIVSLAAGDRMVILAHNGVNDLSGVWNLRLALPSGYTCTLSSLKFETANDAGGLTEKRTIVGPCNVTVDGNSVTYIAYKIIRASDNSIKPSNVIVLPADVDGDMQLVFESSDDLLTWNQVYSFTHNSTNQASRFFRTRLIQTEQ